MIQGNGEPTKGVEQSYDIQEDNYRFKMEEEGGREDWKWEFRDQLAMGERERMGQ